MLAQPPGRLVLFLTLSLASAGVLVLPAGRPGGTAAESPGAAPPGKVPFKVPPGFVVERVAGPPVVEYPITAEFDDRGRLLVAHSSGLNVRGKEVLLKERPHSVRVLEDITGAGRFDKFTVFADKMTFPTGALWHDGAVYCCSAPYLWKLQDTTGAGRADRREQLVGEFNFDGHTADIKGPFLGPDGRLYWTDGADGHDVRLGDGTRLKGSASRIFRCKTDGTALESVCAGGTGNMAMMTFSAEGEPFAACTLLDHYPVRKDGVWYGIDGGVYPPYHPITAPEFKQRTGDWLPPIELGHQSPSGILRYRGDALGPEYRDNLFVTTYNTHKVLRLRLERDGAGFKARAEDFLVSDDEHFHPTYVLQDGDGSLLVVDTGGWITVACWVSQLKPDAKGGIYRVRRTDAPKVEDPHGLKLKWDRLPPAELVKLLDDPRFRVRDRAVARLAKHGASALAALKAGVGADQPVRARRNSVWALTRMEGAAALAALRPALDDKDMSVRLAAAHAVGLHRDAEARPRLRALLVKGAPAVRREAASALGRIKDKEGVPALLEALRGGGDPFLLHALIYALIQIADRDATLKGLSDAAAHTRRGALIALDQMDGGNLTQELVAPLLATDDEGLQNTALSVLFRRGWGGPVVGLVKKWLAAGPISAKRQEILRQALAALRGDAGVQQLVSQALGQAGTPTATRLLLLETIADTPPNELPAAWRGELERALDHAEEAVARHAVSGIRAHGLARFDEKLLRLARDKGKSADLRVAALAAAAPRLRQFTPADFDLLRGQLSSETSALVPLDAARALASVKLTDEQLSTLASAVTKARTLEFPHLLGTYERSANPEVGRKVLTALSARPGLAGLTHDALRQTLDGYPEEVRTGKEARKLFEQLDAATAARKARLDELEPLLKGGNPQNGQAVFLHPKASCSSCHTVRSQGGKVGPDLSTIGAVRSGRDLLEAIAFPSASFARGYEPYLVETTAGKVYSGMIKRETAAAVFLTAADLSEVRIRRSEIESIRPGEVSIMPQGLEAGLTRQELSDLLAFLQSLR